MHHFNIFLKTFLLASARLPYGFEASAWPCTASVCLPSDLGDSRQLPDELHVGSSKAPNVFDTVLVLTGRFPKYSRSCPQRGSLQDWVQKQIRRRCWYIHQGLSGSYIEGRFIHFQWWLEGSFVELPNAILSLNKNIIVGAIYRPSGSDLMGFNEWV